MLLNSERKISFLLLLGMFLWTFSNAESINPYKLGLGDSKNQEQKNTSLPFEAPSEIDEENEPDESLNKFALHSRKTVTSILKNNNAKIQNIRSKKHYISSGSVRGPPGFII